MSVFRERVSVFRKECPYLGIGCYDQKTITNNTVICGMFHLYIMTINSSKFVQGLTDLSVIYIQLFEI